MEVAVVGVLFSAGFPKLNPPVAVAVVGVLSAGLPKLNPPVAPAAVGALSAGFAAPKLNPVVPFVVAAAAGFEKSNGELAPFAAGGFPKLNGEFAVAGTLLSAGFAAPNENPPAPPTPGVVPFSAGFAAPNENPPPFSAGFAPKLNPPVAALALGVGVPKLNPPVLPVLVEFPNPEGGTCNCNPVGFEGVGSRTGLSSMLTFISSPLGGVTGLAGVVEGAAVPKVNGLLLVEVEAGTPKLKTGVPVVVVVAGVVEGAAGAPNVNIPPVLPLFPVVSPPAGPGGGVAGAAPNENILPLALPLTLFSFSFSLSLPASVEGWPNENGVVPLPVPNSGFGASTVVDVEDGVGPNENPVEIEGVLSFSVALAVAAEGAPKLNPPVVAAGAGVDIAVAPNKLFAASSFFSPSPAAVAGFPNENAGTAPALGAPNENPPPPLVFSPLVPFVVVVVLAGLGAPNENPPPSTSMPFSPSLSSFPSLSPPREVEVEPAPKIPPTGPTFSNILLLAKKSGTPLGPPAPVPVAFLGAEEGGGGPYGNSVGFGVAVALVVVVVVDEETGVGLGEETGNENGRVSIGASFEEEAGTGVDVAAVVYKPNINIISQGDRTRVE